MFCGFACYVCGNKSDSLRAGLCVRLSPLRSSELSLRVSTRLRCWQGFRQGGGCAWSGGFFRVFAGDAAACSWIPQQEKGDAHRRCVAGLPWQMRWLDWRAVGGDTWSSAAYPAVSSRYDVRRSCGCDGGFAGVCVGRRWPAGMRRRSRRLSGCHGSFCAVAV